MTTLQEDMAELKRAAEAVTKEIVGHIQEALGELERLNEILVAWRAKQDEAGPLLVCPDCGLAGGFHSHDCPRVVAPHD